MSKPAICIASQQAYGAMRGGRSGFVGGIEWQTTLTAKWFASRGYPVSILTWNEGGPDEESIDGVRVVKLCRHTDGFRILRFFHPRWSSLVRAMTKVDADIYYQNGSECTTGQVALWAKRHGKTFIFATASDADSDPALPELHPQEKTLYRMGLKRADEVIVQTLTQQRMLRKHFGRESVVIPMPCPDRAGEIHRETPPANPRVLWIGRICAVKRPAYYLDLADACPNLQFDLVGPFGSDIDEQTFRKRADKIANLVIHGGVPRDKTPEFYSRAAVLCSTSEYEGFPNTFLEAWSHGVPVVSTFDPDNVIERMRLGRAVKNARELPSAVNQVLESTERYRQFSQNARRYFAENHKTDVVLPRFEKLFLERLARNQER